jgi:hypothetical protein
VYVRSTSMTDDIVPLETVFAASTDYPLLREVSVCPQFGHQSCLLRTERWLTIPPSLGLSGVCPQYFDDFFHPFSPVSTPQNDS